MPGKRLSMRKIKEVLRLRFDVGLSGRQIAHSCGMGRTTVREYLWRGEGARGRGALSGGGGGGGVGGGPVVQPPPCAGGRSPPGRAKGHREI